MLVLMRNIVNGYLIFFSLKMFGNWLSTYMSKNTSLPISTEEIGTEGMFGGITLFST